MRRCRSTLVLLSSTWIMLSTSIRAADFVALPTQTLMRGYSRSVGLAPRVARSGVAPISTQTATRVAEDEESGADAISGLDMAEARRKLEHWSNLPLIPVTTSEELNNVLKTARRAGRIVLVDYYAPWCRVCRRMYQTLERLSREERFADVAFAVVNFEHSRKLTKERNIKKLPTMEIWRDEELQQSWFGGKREKLLDNLLHELAASPQAATVPS